MTAVKSGGGYGAVKIVYVVAAAGRVAGDSRLGGRRGPVVQFHAEGVV